MKTSPNKAVVALSGGLDSSTLLAYVLDKGIEVLAACAFNYGSKHNPYENLAAREVAEHYKVPFRLIDVTGVMRGFDSNLLQGGGDIPEGHYQEESMRLTVVPGRNLIFISVLAGLAESMGAGRVYIGTHRGDHFIYPDCRPEFINAACTTVYTSSDGKVELNAPFTHMSKAEIVGIGLLMNVPFHLTRTCYSTKPIACGKCGSCQERLEAFNLNNCPDPIEYECRHILSKKG